MNNLDREVAEKPDELIVYGGAGKAARNWPAYDAIVRSIQSLENDETLLVASGVSRQTAGAMLLLGGSMGGELLNPAAIEVRIPEAVSPQDFNSVITAVQQAIGTARKNAAGAAFLRKFVEEAKASGLVAGLIARHKVIGLSVAPTA